MSASSSGSSKNPGVASGGGCPNLGLWGRRPGLGGDIIMAAARGGSKPPAVFPPLFFRGLARGARCSRGARGPWVASRRGFSAGAASADAGGGDLAAGGAKSDSLRLRGARPRNSLWVLRGPLATIPSNRCVWRGGAGGFSGAEAAASLGMGSFKMGYLLNLVNLGERLSIRAGLTHFRPLAKHSGRWRQ